MQWWRNLIKKWRVRRGEVTITDQLLNIDNGGKSAHERRERRRVAARINELLPIVYAQRTTTHALATTMIRPILSVRHPHKKPFMHYNPGEFIVRPAREDVEAVIIDFTLYGTAHRYAFTGKGKLYRYYKELHSEQERQRDVWMPVSDLERSKIASTTLRAIEKWLERFTPGA